MVFLESGSAHFASRTELDFGHPIFYGKAAKVSRSH